MISSRLCPSSIIRYRIAFQDVVRRQRIGIFLFEPELRRRSLDDRADRDDLPVAVDVTRQVVNFAFVQVADDAQGSYRIAVQGSVTDCDLAFIGGRQQDIPEFIGYRHHHHAPDARLHVFLGHIERKFPENGAERRSKRRERFVDRDDLVFDTEVFGQRPRVLDRMIR